MTTELSDEVEVEPAERVELTELSDALAVIERYDDDESRPLLELWQALEGAGAATPVSLELGPMSYKRWEMVGKFLGAVGWRIDWYIGDWLNHGEALFGEESAQGIEATTAERYSEVERITGKSHGTLMNVRSICSKIAAPRRRSELPFWTQAEVAKLDADEQTIWLQRAVDEGWGRDELRAAIRADKNPPAADDAGGDEAPGPGGLSIGERIEAAARLVWQQAQNNSEGDWIVPASAMAQLRAALGEE